eukprot:729279-Rhodomonas_salina.2
MALSAYGLAMRCPVLIYAVLLRVSYAMPGTDVGYAATRSYGSRIAGTGGCLSCYGVARRCPSGTDVAYGAFVPGGDAQY